MPSTNARPKELSKKEVRKLFKYDASIGRLRWRREPSLGKNKVGEVAGGINVGSGYRQIVCNGQPYGEHRLIWIYHYGDIPADRTPDHINQIKDDNHLSNLRLLTDAEQMYAKPAPAPAAMGALQMNPGHLGALGMQQNPLHMGALHMNPAHLGALQLSGMHY